MLCCSIEMYVRLSLLHMPWAANLVDKWERNKWGENPLLLYQHKNRNKYFVIVAFIDKEWSDHVRKPLAERETWEVLLLAEREAGEVLPLAEREPWETIPCPLSMSKTPWSRAFFRRSSTMTGMTMMMMTATATHRPTYSGMLSSSSARLAAENKQPSLYRDLTQPSSYRDLTQTISLPWINTTGCWTQAAISLHFLTVI